MISAEEVFVLENSGIQGDRYQLKNGFWSKTRPEVRPLSIISSEAIAKTPFAPIQTRRNVVVRGFPQDMTGYVGIEIYFGQIYTRGLEPCTSCNRPSDICGIPNFRKQFLDQEGNRGGLRVAVLNSGILRLGDPVKL